ncbi:ribbon-helix-helix protein, CopG family [Nocardia sp. FBN12]|uniref:ribbon-helix-helix protein, CopG family n=1 Tax=Nocardia sp. FBN12 TaxID=3419766 RepID=UPI003D06E18C
MAMTLRLNGDDDRRLSELAERLGRSKQDLAQEAIHMYVARQAEAFGAMVDSIMDEHAELMRRLA